MDRARPRLPWTEIWLTLAGIALLAAIVLLVPELRHACEAAIRGDTDEVRRQINGLGVGGPMLIIALTLIHTVIPFPAEIINAAAGFAYGFFPAIALVTVGWMISALLAYGFGRSVARPLLDRWFGAERFERLERMIDRGGVTLLLAVRLIPIIPFSLAGYAAGAARVPVWRFLWTTLVGYMPITAIAVYFGTRLEGLRLTDPIVLGSIALIVALLLLGHWIVRRQADREAAASAEGDGTELGDSAPTQEPERVSGSERP
ncbi:MAG TPA: VTT domain-containing protein [Solirubrobacterales bacterium]